MASVIDIGLLRLGDSDYRGRPDVQAGGWYVPQYLKTLGTRDLLKNIRRVDFWPFDKAAGLVPLWAQLIPQVPGWC